MLLEMSWLAWSRSLSLLSPALSGVDEKRKAGLTNSDLGTTMTQTELVAFLSSDDTPQTLGS